MFTKLFSNKKETETKSIHIDPQKTGSILSGLYRYIFQLKEAGKSGGTMCKIDGSEIYHVMVFSQWVFITATLNNQVIAENVTIEELEVILIAMQSVYNNI